jgi:hypothetical protein
MKNAAWRSMNWNDMGKIVHVQLPGQQYLYLSKKAKSRFEFLATNQITKETSFINCVKNVLDAVDTELEKIFRPTVKQDQIPAESFMAGAQRFTSHLKDTKSRINEIKKGKFKPLFDKVDSVKPVSIKIPKGFHSEIILDSSNFNPLTEEMMLMWPKDATSRPETIAL